MIVAPKILELLKAEDLNSKELAELSGANFRVVQSKLKMLRESGEIHITRYEPRDNQNEQCRRVPIYRFGPGKDAKEGKLGPKEVQRLYWIRHKAAIAARRAVKNGWKPSIWKGLMT